MTQTLEKVFPETTTPTVATAGTFDGVHRGHMAVLSELVSTAKNEGLEPLAITFDRHPLEVVAPHRAPQLLSGGKRQRELIESTGATLLRIPFDRETAAMSAREWLRLLRDKAGANTLVIGYDNTFGHDGLNMSIADYIELGREEGIMVKEAPLIPGISSSAVRKAVASGDVDAAREMLGRPYELDGVVVKGKALGRTLGFPTANLESHPIRLVPGEGVYAAVAITPDGERHPAMVNIGYRPTVETNGKLTTEVHIIDWEGDLYTRPLILLFLSRIRDERHFDSLDELKAQLTSDAQKAKKIFLEKSC